MKCYLYILEMNPDIQFKLIPLDGPGCEDDPLDVVSAYSPNKFGMVSRSHDMKNAFYSQVAHILEADLDSMQRMTNLALNRFASFNNFWESENTKGCADK